LGVPLELTLPPTQGTGLLGGLMKAIGADRVIEKGNRAARDFYMARVKDDDRTRYVTRLDVVLNSDPFDAASVATLGQIQIWLEQFLPESAQRLGHLQAECYG